MRQVNRSIRRRALTWLLSGAAFVAVMLTSGCISTSNGSKQAVRTEFAPVATRDPSHGLSMDPSIRFDETPTPAPPPTVNIFGELNGVAPSPVAPVGRFNFQQHSFVTEGYDGDVSLDPAARRMVFSSTRHSDRPHLYSQRVDGTSVTQLTADDADDAFPVFSPDGKQIAFSSTRAGNWDIYLMDC
ncbi:MAG: TolB family protein, partial [Tepidisphaeraceae bacterium]